MPTTEIVNLAHVAGQPQLSIHTYDMAFGGASTGDMGTKAAVQLPGLAAPVTLMGNHQCPTPLAHQVQQVQRHRLRLGGCRSATNHETERQQNAEGASAGLRRSSTPLMGAHHSYSGCWLLQQGCCTATSRPHPTRQWPNTRQMFTLASPVFPAHRSSEIGSVHRLTVPLATLHLSPSTCHTDSVVTETRCRTEHAPLLWPQQPGATTMPGVHDMGLSSIHGSMHA